MKSPPESKPQLVWLLCLAGFALVAITALRAVPQISDLFIGADGDDQMRLVQVRDWLGGQGWFDVRQYRVLPPEGISMHWSRYLDAGIAAVLTAAGSVLPADRAEHAMLILWPSLLAALMVLLHVHGTSRLFGPSAAIGALAVLFSWSKLGGEFAPARIDHHNLQILCATALFYLALVPGRALVLGALGGAIMAFGLAIGLEMLPFYATVWGLMALRHAFGKPGSGDWLIGFGTAFGLAAPLLMAGQLPISDWDRGYCDVLAMPVLALGAIGITATLLPVAFARWLPTPLSRIATQVAVAVLGLWLAYPLLGQCLAGPYSQVPDAVRQIIESNVIEARPASLLLRLDPALLAGILMPPVVLMLLALPTAWRLWPRLDDTRKAAILQAALVAMVGLAFALVQIRAANLMTPAIPVLAGLLVHGFSLIPRQSLWRSPALAVLLLALPATVGRLTTLLDRQPQDTGAIPTTTMTATGCRTPAAMAEISSLPPSIIFSTLNVGPTILAYTRQSVTSAAYHRSPDAFWNGFGAFSSLDALREALIRSRADYVALCIGGSLESSSPVMREILSGKPPVWLTDVSGDRKEFQVLQVDKVGITTRTDTP